jgi:2-C-methyl-D-erythritol 4-phosphate cytidylyltransferase
MRAAALLLAAGRGERLGATGGKGFLELAGRPLLAYSVETVEASDPIEAFVVAAPSGREDDAKAEASSSRKLHAVVAGGQTRQGSVRRALGAVPEGFDAVVIHDVARPFAPAALFERSISALSSADGAVPAVPLADTLKRVAGDDVLETLPREDLVTVQTPQAFRRRPLEEAHSAADREGFVATDDAALLERAGFRVVTFPGDPENRKITVPEDLRWAEALVRARGG